MKIRLSRVLVALLTACPLVFFVGQPAMHADGEPIGAQSKPLFFGNPWKVSDTTWVAPRMAFSPDGQYIAALGPARGVPVPTPVGHSSEASPSQKEVVIWRVNDGVEVARHPVTYGWNVVWAGDTVVVDNAFWKWKNEKLVPATAFTVRADNPAAHWLSLDGDLYLEQLSRDRSSMRAFRVSNGDEVVLAPRIVRRIQELPPDSDSAPAFDNKQVALDTAPFKGSVRVVVSREVLSDDDAPGGSFGSSLHHAQVSAWDLATGRELWKWPTRFRYFAPQLSWSPDGRLVAVLGTLSPDANILQREPKIKMDGLPIERLGNNGIQILDATTGQLLSSFNVLHTAGSLSRESCQWSRGAEGNTFVLDDWVWIPHANGPFEQQRLLRFFDVRTGREVKRWDVTKQWPLDPSDDDRKETWAVRGDGLLWALATTQDGLRVFRDSDFSNIAPQS